MRIPSAPRPADPTASAEEQRGYPPILEKQPRYTARIGVDDVVRRVLENIGVPPRFLGARLSTFQPRPGTQAAVAAIHDYLSPDWDADDPVILTSLVLTGPPGTGKTHLASAVLAENIRGSAEFHWPHEAGPSTARFWARMQDTSARFVSVPRLLDGLRRRISDDADEDPSDGLDSVNVLVLDDLGVEKSTDWTVDRLTTLVGARYDEQLDTIVTSNYSLEELADRGYDRIVSRLMENGRHVRLTAADYRLRAAS